MKKLMFLIILISNFAFSQMPDISRVWENNDEFYNGTIGDTKQPLKVKIIRSEQDKKNDQIYNVSGETLVDKEVTNFSGKIIIKQYKDGRKRTTIYGEYEFFEEENGKHSGVLKGKFVYNFTWNKKSESIDNQFIQFIGNWKNYKGNLDYKTDFKNQ